MRTKLSPATTSLYIAILLSIAGLSGFALHAAGHPRTGSQAPATSHSPLTAARATKAYGELPLAFEKNEGQSAAPVKYLAHGAGYEVFLTPQEAVLALQPSQKAPFTSVSQLKDRIRAAKSQKSSDVRIQLKGANASPAIAGENQLARKTSYFTGNDRRNWHTDIPSYSAVQYKGVYSGVDLLFYGNHRRLEYDFQVAPGADPKQIALHVQGARKLHLDAAGNLVVKISAGDVEFLKPVVYQNVKGSRKEVAANYVLGANNDVRFSVAAYDATRPLIIDPVLNYSTFLGGSGDSGEALAVAVDTLGNAYVTGQTFSASFPTGTTVGLGTPDVNVGTNGAAFVSEINPAGTTELYFSYLSGDGGEAGGAIAVDPVPNTSCMNGASLGICVYVAGQTFSDNFPLSTTVTPYNSTPPGGPGGGDAFIAKLNPNVAGTSSLVYSTYLASNGTGDFADAVAVDVHQHAFLTGETLSPGGAVPNFPVMNAAQGTNNVSGNGNAFLTVLDTTTGGTAGLLYSTFLGGGGQLGGGGIVVGDIGQRVVVDASGVAYIAGITSSSDFPSIASTGTYPSIKGYSALPAGNTQGAAFVSAIDTTKTGVASLLYSTYLGGSSTTEPDNAFSLALAGSGVVYVVGTTHSADFPLSQTGSTAGQFPSPPASDVTDKAFVVKLDTTTTISPPPATPTYSVLIGGSNGEVGRGIQVDTLGKVVIDGLTQSSNFPVTPGAFQPALAAAAQGDAFVSKLDPTVTGSAGLLYSSSLGGSGVSGAPDGATDLALDTLGNAYIVGQANSGTNFPIFPSGAFESTFPSGAASVGFVAKLTLIPTVTVSPTSLTFTGQVVGVKSSAQTVTFTNNTNVGVTFTTAPTVVAGAPPASSTDFATTGNTCTGTIAAGGTCTVGVTFTPSVTSTETATLTFTDSDTSSPQTVSLTGSGTVASSTTVTVLPATLTFASQTVNTASSPQTVTVTNTGNTAITLGSTVTSITGTNAGDFSLSNTSTCTSSLVLTTSGAGSSCTIKVVFTPAATGARTATLSVADSATGSPQAVTLNGTGTAVATNTVTVLPATLTFASQTVNTASSAQAITVTNTGGTPVTLGATVTSITGTNAGDFSIANTSTCTSSLVLTTSGAASSCMIQVVFTPAAAGARAAMLSVADSATGSPQIVTLNGTGTAAVSQDFSLTPATQNVSVTQGGSQTFTVSVVGVGGFTGAVTLSCTGAPRNSTCAAPSAVNASASGTAATFTISSKGLLPPASRNVPPASPKQLVLLAGALSLFLLLPSVRRFRTRLGLAGAMAVFVIVAGCSGTPPTPKGSYTLTVTGTSGNLSHTAAVNLTVQ